MCLKNVEMSNCSLSVVQADVVLTHFSVRKKCGICPNTCIPAVICIFCIQKKALGEIGTDKFGAIPSPTQSSPRPLTRLFPGPVRPED